MTRPVRPVALVILTACMLYPGLTSLYQGLLSVRDRSGLQPGRPARHGDGCGRAAWHLPVWLPLLFKSLLGLAWLAGVPGLWAGDPRLRSFRSDAAYLPRSRPRRSRCCSRADRW